MKVSHLLCILPLLLQSVPVARATPSKDVYAIDPHHNERFCRACHVDMDTDELRTEDYNALCGRCHDPEEHRKHIHVTDAAVTGLEVPEGWRLREGKLTCLTCHLPGHEEDAEIPLHLRDGPYTGKKDFCHQCHEQRQGFGNPHLDLNRKRTCTPCHTVADTVSLAKPDDHALSAPVGVICLGCHDYLPHPANVSHLMSLSPVMAVNLPKAYPLRRGRITCATCHNPHQMETGGFKLRETVLGLEICSRCHNL
jgi:predicted CXXCH cytochrome family protein